MTVHLLVEGRLAVAAPAEGDFQATLMVPDHVGAELIVTLGTSGPNVAREFRLVRWTGEAWAGRELICTVSRHGAAVQPYVAWPEIGPEHDPEGRAEYRLQPFMLGQPEGGAGQGVFERGFCWSGRVTPGWVFMAARCSAGDPFCFRTYHAGFSELGYAYCERDSAVGTWNVHDEPPAATEAFGEWRATKDLSAFARGVSEIDSRLQGQPCSCGGSFAYLNPLRCPTDGSVYVDLADPRRRMDEYYFIQLHNRPMVKLHLG